MRKLQVLPIGIKTQEGKISINKNENWEFESTSDERHTSHRRLIYENIWSMLKTGRNIRRSTSHWSRRGYCALYPSTPATYFVCNARRLLMTFNASVCEFFALRLFQIWVVFGRNNKCFFFATKKHLVCSELIIITFLCKILGSLFRRACLGWHKTAGHKYRAVVLRRAVKHIPETKGETSRVEFESGLVRVTKYSHKATRKRMWYVPTNPAGWEPLLAHCVSFWDVRGGNCVEAWRCVLVHSFLDM